jgi:hypothetical protein
MEWEDKEWALGDGVGIPTFLWCLFTLYLSCRKIVNSNSSNMPAYPQYLANDGGVLSHLPKSAGGVIFQKVQVVSSSKKCK